MFNPAVGKVSSEFSPNRRNPVTGRYEMHAGIDIANKVGTPIYAAYAGVVERVGTNVVSGRTGTGILIRNPDGEKQYYGHLSKANVKVGQSVSKGQKIGEMGATGNVTGPHLHFETWNKSGSPVNPRIHFSYHKLTPGVASRPFSKWYVVNTAPGVRLMGRAKPSTKSAIKYRRNRGFRIRAVDIVSGDGREWAVTAYGTYYALSYLKAE